MTRRLTAATLVLTLVLTLTGCRGFTYEVLNRHKTTNAAIMRTSCRIHYRINVHEFSDRGRAYLGYDIVTMLHDRITRIGNVTGTKWVFDGYTTGSISDKGEGSRYARNDGVLIELGGPRIYSQPLPTIGPVHKGGILYLPLAQFKRDYRTYADRVGVIDHELGHQYGLGDLYDTAGGPMDRTQKMGDHRQPWGRGDLDGFKYMTAKSKATCAAEQAPKPRPAQQRPTPASKTPEVSR